MELLVRILPSSWVYALAPEGGASATAIISFISTLASWFLVLFAIAFFVTGRRVFRGQSANHPVA